ncbi:MAG: DNA polymerase III subunit delta [Phycisphaerales bacterium]|nr:DNA polymerase III subunit delta [Planctomycetota bacterium]
MAKKPAATTRQDAPAGTLDADCRIALLAGPVQFIAAEHTAALKDKLIAKFGEVDVLTFDGASASPAEVYDECRSFGLMQQHKLIVVDNADQFVKDDKRSLAERYAQDPCENATLILRSARWNKGKLDEMIAASGAIVPCEPVSEASAAAWAIRRAAKRHEAKLDQRAADMLVENVGTDLGRIDAELGKLAVAGDPPGSITPELVARFVGRSREEEVWGLQATLVGGSGAESIAHIRDLIEVSRQPAVMISWAMIDLARKLHGVARGTRAGMNPFALAGSLRLFGPAKDAILSAGSRANPEELAKVLDECIRADVRQKTGVGDVQRSLEILALRFAQVCPGRN